jgi:hypothetical protein
MAGKPFDATVKELIEEDAPSWAQAFGSARAQRVSLIDADVSTVTAAADKVLRVEGDGGPWLLDIEPEARYAADAPDRLLLYSTILRQRHRLPVRSVLLLLRREANASNLTGLLEVRADEGDEQPYLTFRYQVVRLWQQPLAPLLAGGLGPLPLAVLTDEAASDLSGVVKRIDERLRTEAPPERADKMRTATFLLLGLRYDVAVADQLFREITNMEESSTYQMILSRGRDQGRTQEARAMLLRLGRVKFGEPDAAALAALERITSLERLEGLGERLLRVDTWAELLAGA